MKIVMLAVIVLLSYVQLIMSEMTFQAQSTLHFKALVSKATKRKHGKHGHATKLKTKIKPCGTGLEGTGTFSVSATSPDCINEVFKLTDVKNLPVTAMVPIWLAEKLGIESTNDTPFIRRFAIVLCTGVSMVRQLLETQVFASFVSTWKTFSGMLFKPSSPMMLKYVKGSVLKMMAKDIIAQIIDTVASPCDLIPDVGIAFIGSVNFQLSKWCRFGVTSLLKRLLNALIAKAGPLIKGVAGKKKELECYQLDKLVQLLIGRIDKEYTVFVSGPDDMSKIMTPGICLDTRTGKLPPAPMDEGCCTLECAAAAAGGGGGGGGGGSGSNTSKTEGEPEDEPEKDDRFRFMEVETRGPGPETNFLKLLPNMFKGEVLQYGLMNLLESLFDVAFDGVNEQIKKFISWTNKFVGAAKALKEK